MSTQQSPVLRQGKGVCCLNWRVQIFRVNAVQKIFSNAVKELQQCYVCTESFDHTGNKIDNGPGNCFNLVGDEYIEECDPIDDSCETVLSADWFLDGTQVHRFTRKCQRGGSDSDGYTNCVEGASSTIQFKDCYNICTGNGCNNNSDVVNAHSKLDENGDPIEIR